LERLNDLLDEVGDDIQQQNLIAQWFEQLGEERDRKLDAYAALITEMTARAAMRKAESQRLPELASSNENQAGLKERLKWFFEVHNLKDCRDTAYKLQLAKNGGKAPLILDESVPVINFERFQKVSIDPNTMAIREALLERGESLEFAMLGERYKHAHKVEMLTTDIRADACLAEKKMHWDKAIASATNTP